MIMSDVRGFVIFIILAFLPYSACAVNKVPISEFHRIDKKMGSYTKHFQESLFKATDKGLYSVELLLFDGNLKTGRNDFDIVIHDSKDDDVEGATLEIIARMPENRIEAAPKIKGSLPGLYGVHDLNLNMGGHWELLIQVSKDGKEDRVIFVFPDVE
jgi:hypothetical protein